MASEAQVKTWIAEAIGSSEARLEQRVAQHVQAKIDEHEEKVGKIVSSGANMIELLTQQTVSLTSSTSDAQSRADNIIRTMNEAASAHEASQKTVEEYVLELKDRTKQMIDNLIGKFNTDNETQKEELEKVKEVINNVASDGAKRLESQISEVYAWSVRFTSEMKAKFDENAQGTQRGNFNLAKNDKPMKLDKKDISVGKM